MNLADLLMSANENRLTAH